MRYKPLSSPFYIFENKKHKNFKLFAKVTHVVIGKDGIWIKVVLKPNAWAELIHWTIRQWPAQGKLMSQKILMCINS